ncbi:SPARC related modular calcium binding-like protein magu isoform X2 [Lycorma delicatula]|uniref:SPARC related modular calcium binding-like protein magu isoform X2 n=1 Tax=Lycorma delicatula TaxID=130591 RepID=UPI003F516FCB
MGSWCLLMSVLAALLLLVQAVSSTEGRSAKDCEKRIANCETSMNLRDRMKPVCGSDNMTYPSRCTLLRYHCHKGEVTVKHKGHCRVVLNRSKAGRKRENKAKPQKRSKTGGGKRQRKKCKRVDRSAYVNDLMKLYSTEYQQVVDEANDEPENILLKWKFNSLDVDHSGWLDSNELKRLTDQTVKLIQPKRCARSFERHCDLDQNGRITSQEWTSCHALHLNLSFRLFLSLNSAESEDDVTDMEAEDSFGVLQENSASLMEGGGHSLLGEENDQREEPEASNCFTDQKTALDGRKLETSNMYVPECTPDGRYKKIQCYNSTGYCWCVHEDTGKTIPGTSVKDLHPKCDAIPQPSRPMKGCPEFKKQVFLKDLMEFFLHTMATQKLNVSGNDSAPIPTGDQLDEDQIATWNFHKLDLNKNKVLDRKEWIAFRSIITPNAKLRQCGKKLPRYCDVNSDRKVSLTEWINCLNATKTKISTSEITLSSTVSPKRRGISPLETYLKGD